MPVFTVNSATGGGKGNEALVKAVTHASPVVALEALYIERFSKYKQTKQGEAQKAQIYSPQYVFFYFQCSLYPLLADGVLVVSWLFFSPINCPWCWLPNPEGRWEHLTVLLIP